MLVLKSRQFPRETGIGMLHVALPAFSNSYGNCGSVYCIPSHEHVKRSVARRWCHLHAHGEEVGSSEVLRMLTFGLLEVWSNSSDGHLRSRVLRMA